MFLSITRRGDVWQAYWSDRALILSCMVILPCNACIQRSMVKFTDLALGFVPLEYYSPGLMFSEYRIAVFQ